MKKQKQAQVLLVNKTLCAPTAAELAISASKKEVRDANREASRGSEPELEHHFTEMDSQQHMLSRE